MVYWFGQKRIFSRLFYLCRTSLKLELVRLGSYLIFPCHIGNYLSFDNLRLLVGGCNILIVVSIGFVFFLCFLSNFLVDFLFETYVFFPFLAFLIVFATFYLLHLSTQLLLVLHLFLRFTFCLIWVHQKETPAVGLITWHHDFWMNKMLRFPAERSDMFIIKVYNSFNNKERGRITTFDKYFKFQWWKFKTKMY
jgi:hypothetical protein